MSDRLAQSTKLAVLTLVFLLAFSLRMWDIDARSLWFDEAYEYWSASTDLGGIPRTVLSAYQPPLYSLVLHFWLRLGEEAVWLRFLSVACSMLSLAGIALWSGKLSGWGGALIASLIMAVLPSEIRYAQEAGEYALMECFLVWGIYFLYQTFSRSTWTNWALWGLFSVLCIYTHYGTIIVVVALALLTYLENLKHIRRSSLGKESAVLASVLLMCIPLLMYFLPRQLQTQAASSAPQLSPLHTELERLAVSLGDSFLFNFTGWPFSPLPKWLGQLVVYSTLLASVVILVRRPARFPGRVVIWFWGVYFVYYLFVRSGLYARGVYGFRYALILSPLLILVVTAVIHQLLQWRRCSVLGYAMLAIILGMAIYSLPNRTFSEMTRGIQLWPETIDVREVTQYWAEHRSKDDMTYVYFRAVPAFRYYARLYGQEPKDQLPPAWIPTCWAPDAPDYCASHGIFYGEWIGSLSPEEMLASMGATFGGMPESFWIVFSSIHFREEGVILEALSDRYSIEITYRQPGASAHYLRGK